MGDFYLEAGKRFREQGEIVEALRCFKSALEKDRGSIDAYIELARTYILAFEGSGDPLCLDCARKVCVAGLRRDPMDAEHRRLFEIQDRIEDLLVESQKAEVDAMTDAMEDAGFGTGLSPDIEPTDGLLDDLDSPLGEDPEIERGH
jgi:hypothetical protein